VLRFKFAVHSSCLVVVENLDLPRQPFSTMDAVYLLAPTQDSIDKGVPPGASSKAPLLAYEFSAVINDFSPQKTKLQYAGIHLLFTSRMPP
jgi:hypothetical protein